MSNDLSPCSAPGFDPCNIAGTVPEGFVRWYSVPDEVKSKKRRPLHSELRPPSPKEILDDPEKWLQSLRAHLQMGLGVEVFTLPPYLSAMWSIKPETNEDSLYLIRGVLMEEMLHMTLAANVLSAVGGSPKLASSDVIEKYPSRIPFSGLDLVVGLNPFSQATLCGMRAVETPDELAPKNPDWYDDLGFTSIGEFYSVVIDMLWTLTLVLGPQAVFSGDESNQVRPWHYYGGGGDIVTVPAPDGPLDLGGYIRLLDAADQQRVVLRKCASLRRAIFAIHTIVSQGEGATGVIADFDFFRDVENAGATEEDVAALESAGVRGPVLRSAFFLPDGSDVVQESAPAGDECLSVDAGNEVFGDKFEPAHFYKFDSVIKGQYYQRGDCGLHPTGRKFDVNFDESWPMKPNPYAGDYTDHPEIHELMVRFNKTFTALLQCLEDVYNGDQDKMRKAVEIMYDLKYQGEGLMRLPIPGDPQGRTVGAPFELDLS